MSGEDIPHTLAAGLLELKNSKILTDITIFINDDQFECHKVVLAAISPYFRSMFSSNFKEKHEKDIHIKDIKPEAFGVILQLIYTERNDIDQCNVEGVLNAASMLQIDCILKRCEDFLIKNLSPATCVQIWRMSIFYGRSVTEEKAFNYVLDNFKELALLESFQELCKEELIKIISENKLNVYREEDVCDFVMQWVKKDALRNELLGELLEYVRIPLLHPRYLRNLIQSDPVFESNSKIMHLLNRGMALQAVSEFRLSSSNTSSFHRSRMSDMDCFIAGTLSCPGGDKFLLFDFSEEEIRKSTNIGHFEITDLLYTDGKLYALGYDSYEGPIHLLVFRDPDVGFKIIPVSYECGSPVVFSTTTFMISIDDGIYFLTEENESYCARYYSRDQVLTDDQVPDYDIKIPALKNVKTAVFSKNVYLIADQENDSNVLLKLDDRCLKKRVTKVDNLAYTAGVKKVMVEEDVIYILFDDGNMWTLHENLGTFSQSFLLKISNFDFTEFSSTIHLGKLYLFAAGKEIKVIDLQSGAERDIPNMKVPENVSCKFSTKVSLSCCLIEVTPIL